MNVGSRLIADGEAAELPVPGKCALHDPAVTSQFCAALNAPPSDARLNVALGQGTSASAVIIRLVRVQFARPLAWRSPALPDGRHSINQRLQHSAVMHVGAGEPQSEWDAVRIREDVALRACLAAVRRVWAGRRAPFLAATAALSSAARLKSIALCWPKRSSRTCCSFCQTPACCQSRKRRQHVMPEPQPISWGSIFQGVAERRMNRMPVRAARSLNRGRPPLGLGGSGGRRGSITAQRASETRGLPCQTNAPMPVLLGALNCFQS